MNWAKGLNDKGEPIRIPEKDHHVGGALVSGNNGGATNWPPGTSARRQACTTSRSPKRFACITRRNGSAWRDGPRRQGGGHARIEGQLHGGARLQDRQASLEAPVPGLGAGSANGLLTTAGGLLFGGDVSGDLVSYDARTGQILWHAKLGAVSNAPQTYMLDGRQYLLVASGDTLFAFAVNE